MNMQEKELYTILQERFGLKKFRPGQLEAILHLLTDKRVLCIQPTGFGKSLLYQLPSLLLPGITLVISPLLALMRDQIDRLNDCYTIPAASMNSDQTEEENRAVREQILNQKIKILFVAPEQFDHLDRFEFLLNLPVSLIVVDEAHCISTWGHDFRPSYRQIIHYVRAKLKENPQVHILGLTATANNETEIDIAKQLIPQKILRASTERTNISLSVIHTSSVEAKLSTCLDLMNKLYGYGIIYCATRENTELVSHFLKEQGVNAAAYHAGLNPEAKRSLQKAFIDDRFKVCVATNALGMGIDKPNISFIVHFDFPGSITAYYQEVGRAGRDGSPASGILLYDKADYRIQKYFIDSSQPTLDDFSKVLQVIEEAKEPPNLMTIKRETGLHPTRVLVVVAEYLEQGFIKKQTDSGKQTYVSTCQKKEADLSRFERQYRVKMRELSHMIHYATQNKACYMELLRQALGDHETCACGNCAVCKPSQNDQTDNHARDQNITSWLTSRVGIIPEVKTQNLSEGASLLDAKQRLPICIDFFKSRAESINASDEILRLLEIHAKKLNAPEKAAFLVPIPSYTWKAQRAVAQRLADFLGVPVFDVLAWREKPKKRQGELLNNDQRRHNVQGCMAADQKIVLPKGKIILFDDYVGSGATIREAASALRKKIGKEQQIVPFTIAQVKWKLGSSGMV